jgi:hypothetical protein
VTETIADPTLISTVGTPLITNGPEKRHIRPPSFLNRYKPSQLSAACSQLAQHVIRTQTTTWTRTIPGKAKTATQTVTQIVATNTILTTTTPTPATITTVVSTATVITTETSTTINTVCPTPLFPNSFGIGTDKPETIAIPRAKDAVDCCSKCYYD